MNPILNSGDIAWILVSTALVMLMTAPGLAFFYGGLVRRKNVLSTMMQSFFLLCLISIQWILYGYSLAFGPDVGHFIGTLSWFGLKGVGMEPNPDYAATIPHQLFMVYQMMFAVITPALITGAFAERMKFPTFAVFSLLWATLVYDPVCHWVWGTGGWLKSLGALDFAGGTVVHISSGVSALVCALVLGRRKGYPHHSIPPHNMTYTLLGAALLWFGWFGFNAGSALAANSLAVSAFIATNTAAAAAALVWLLIEWIVAGKPTVLGGATGAVAGLVAITPGRGFRDSVFGDRDRRSGGRGLFHIGDRDQAEVRVRRQPRRLRRSRRGRNGRRPGHRALRRKSGQRRGRGRIAVRQRLPAGRSGDGRRGDGRLFDGRDLHPAEDPRPI